MFKCLKYELYKLTHSLTTIIVFAFLSLYNVVWAVVGRFVIIKDGKVARDCTKEEFEKECNGEELSSYYVKTYC